ncbi:MAG TPA: hypothetical protein VFM60_06545 [Salinimicrobium sp.]|nr:hypothetical protein [Salinimicrobium sp.]
MRDGKVAAIFAYLTIFGTLIGYFLNLEKKYPFAKFHLKQALGIHLTFYLLGVLVSMFNSWLISIPFYIFIFTLLGYGLIGAIQGKLNLVPFLGEYFQKWFSSKK